MSLPKPKGTPPVSKVIEGPTHRYYTPPDKAGNLHDDFHLIWNHIYNLQDQLAEAHGKIAKMSEIGQPGKTDPGGPSTTKIAGLNVKGNPPTEGNQVTTLSKVPVLGFNPATSQWETFILP